MYIHIHTLTKAHTCTHDIHTYIREGIHVHVFMSLYKQIHSHSCILAIACTYLQMVKRNDPQGNLTYTCSRKHTYKSYSYIRTYSYIIPYIRIYSYVNIALYLHVCMYIYIYIYIYIYERKHLYMYICVGSKTKLYTCTYVQAVKRNYIYVHICRQ